MFFPLLIVILALCNFLRIQHKKRSSKEPPELPGKYPLIGHGYKLMGSSVELLQQLIEFGKETEKLGGVSTILLGLRKVYFVSDPDDILTVMNSCLNKEYFHKYASKSLGNGLLITDAENWKKNRKILNPAFNQQILNGFIEVFNSRSLILMDQFSTKVGKTFNHEEILRISNIETLCINLFGIDVEEPEYSQIFKEYIHLVMHIEKYLGKRIQKYWEYSDYIYKWSRDKKVVETETKKLIALSKLLIEKKKNEIKTYSDHEYEYGVKATSFINLLLGMADRGLTEDHIVDEAINIIMAGHETAATTLTFLITELGSHPEVQEKAYKEILEVLGNKDIFVTKYDLSKLVYLEAIIKEAMRLHPIAIIIPRTVVKDVQLKKYTLKAGAEAASSVYCLHRHSMWGADADQFNPERWLDKETLPDPKYYGAFGLGRRNCIGKTYAMISMKIVLAHMIRRFRISADASKIVTKMQILVSPHTGHDISLEFRNGDENK